MTPGLGVTDPGLDILGNWNAFGRFRLCSESLLDGAGLVDIGDRCGGENSMHADKNDEWLTMIARGGWRCTVSVDKPYTPQSANVDHHPRSTF